MPKKNGREAKKKKAKRNHGARGHSKGSAFERAICKELSLWWTHGERDDIFWRTAGSGARATVRRGRGCATANSAGDVCALDMVGQPFVDSILVEMKKGYTFGSERIDVLKMLDALEGRKTCLLQQWLDKAWMEAGQTNRKQAWLIFQRDHAKPILMMPKKALRELDCQGGPSYPYPSITVETTVEVWVLVSLRDFLGWVGPGQVIPTKRRPFIPPRPKPAVTTGGRLKSRVRGNYGN